MSKVKKTTVTEEVEETPIDPAQHLADERASKFLGEKVENNQVVETPSEETPKEEEKPATPPEEEETETVEFDPEQLKREAAEAARKEILQALAGDTKEETAENVDEYQAYQKEFFQKNNRQPSWFEVAHFMEEQAVKKLEAKQEARQKEYTEKTEAEKKALADQAEQTNKYVDDTLKELYTANKLPRIENKDNADDYGLRVRQKLFDTIIAVNQKRIEDKLPPKTIKEVFYEDFKMPARQVAGYDAPVNMGRGGFTPNDNEEIDYKRDIAGPANSFRAIMTRALKGR